jgi:hypothetical protein
MLHEQQPGPAPREPGTVSRRRLVLTGASLAAVGVAVGAAASIPFTAAESAPENVGDGPAKPVMVYLRQGGEFDVFVGQERIKLTDHAFAARLTDAVRAL